MKTYVVALSLLVSMGLFAQDIPELPPAGGGEYITESVKCLSEERRTEISAMIEANIQSLKRSGKFPKADLSRNFAVSFGWPLRQAAGLGFNSYYAVNNFVDQNGMAGQLLDYNCDARTYDGHKGTDIDTWPFPWYMYQNDLVEVVAAEAGTILSKVGVNDDDHCSCSGGWNAIHILHADGSHAWYGHMKKNSLTSKDKDDTVAKGEYLGIIASSGCSTQPHLHFEVYDATGNLVDPYSGRCNNKESWWASQPPNRESTLNAALTHYAEPIHGCPGSNESPKFSDAFDAGARAYFAAYYHDQVTGQVSNYAIKKPNGSVWRSWSHTSPNTYTKSWWFWYWVLPDLGPNGDWSWEVTYQGQTVSHSIAISNALPVELIGLEAKTKGESIRVQWKTASEINNDYFQLERSSNGKEFISLDQIKGHGTTADEQEYFYTDENPLVGTNYYRLKQVDFDGSFQYSDIVSAVMEPGKVLVFPNPTKGVVRIVLPHRQEATIKVFDTLGRLVVEQKIRGETKLSLSGHSKGLYFLEIKSNNQVKSLKIIKE